MTSIEVTIKGWPYKWLAEMTKYYNEQTKHRYGMKAILESIIAEQYGRYRAEVEKAKP